MAARHLVSCSRHMRGGDEPFGVSEVDVVVLDAEDICRAAIVGSLKRFGFLLARVHEVESGEEALERLDALENESRSANVKGMQRGLPVMVFIDPKVVNSSGWSCAQEISARRSQKGLQRQPFLVCTSARPKADIIDGNLFHCSVPKTCTSDKLQNCVELCQRWWLKEHGEPARMSLQPRPAEMSLPMLDTALADPVPGDLASHPGSPPAASALVATAVRLPRRTAADSAAQATSIASAAKVCTQSMESLSNLAPPPTPFEDIDLIGVIGRGSFGRVYRARWHVTTVAVKVVEYFDQELPESMAFEGQLASSLAHPNLVQTFLYSVRDIAGGASSPDGYELWVVQEWCGLGTLWQKICSHQILLQGGFSEVVEVSAEIASAAHYLHCRGIIHGDLTANNVLLLERDCLKGYTTKLSDFGLARVLDRGKSAISKATMGTVQYMPPELFQRDGGHLTKKVDVYSFGILVWQLCTGSIPFEGLQPSQIVVMVAQGALLEMPGNVPDRLSRLYTQSVSRQPADRPRFGKIIQDLLKIVRLEEQFKREAS